MVFWPKVKPRVLAQRKVSPTRNRIPAATFLLGRLVGVKTGLVFEDLVAVFQAHDKQDLKSFHHRSCAPFTNYAS